MRDSKRTKTLLVKLTEQEKNTLQELAQKSHLSMSALIRTTLLKN
jgi:hypothetical protein